MLIGVISDTHNNEATIDLAIAYFKSRTVGLIIHCGDWKSVATAAYFANVAATANLPVRGVLGNNDHDVKKFLKLTGKVPSDFVVQEGVYETEIQGRRIVAYHGHHKPTLRSVRECGADIILLGHTHKPLLEHTEILVVNPGSTAFAIPRSRAWRPSIAIVDTEEVTAEIIYLEDKIQ